MKFLPASVTRTVSRSMLNAQKNSPQILFAVGVAGAVGSTVLACRATLRVESVLEEHEKQAIDIKSIGLTERNQKEELTVLYVRTSMGLVRLYAPAVIVGGFAIGALTKSHNTLRQRNAALSVTLAAVSEAFDQYRRRVVDEYGEEKDRELRFGSQERTVVEDTKQGPKKVQVKSYDPVIAGEEFPYAKIYSRETSKRFLDTPEYNLMIINTAQDYLTDRLRARGHVFLNEAYDELGLDRTPAGAVVGWIYPNPNGDEFVDFGHMNPSRKHEIAEFVSGASGAILLDPNVDGEIWKLI
jgi:hypothetical protein